MGRKTIKSNYPTKISMELSKKVCPTSWPTCCPTDLLKKLCNAAAARARLACLAQKMYTHLWIEYIHKVHGGAEMHLERCDAPLKYDPAHEIYNESQQFQAVLEGGDFDYNPWEDNGRGTWAPHYCHTTKVMACWSADGRRTGKSWVLWWLILKFYYYM